MTVRQLIEKLQKFDPELEVLVGDGEGWFYDSTSPTILRVDEGREVEEPKGAVVVAIGAIR